MIQVPHKLMAKAAAAEGISLGGPRDYGVGMFFLPEDALKRAQAKKMMEIITAKEGMEFLGWRDVPTQPRRCWGARPWTVCPTSASASSGGRRTARRGWTSTGSCTWPGGCSSSPTSTPISAPSPAGPWCTRACSWVGQLRRFYADLTDPDCESALALVHSRFSTNTDPSWQRAHPTGTSSTTARSTPIRGNADRMLAREETMRSAVLEADMDKILPVVDQSGSDSAMLDNTLEFLLMNSIPLPRAVMMCIPEPWANDRRMSREKRDFYHYYATMMEPGTARRPSCSPTATPWAPCWTGTACGPAGGTSPTTRR